MRAVPHRETDTSEQTTTEVTPYEKGPHMDPLEKEAERLDEQMAKTTDPAEKKALREELREIARELNDRERWHDEGREHGWL